MIDSRLKPLLYDIDHKTDIIKILKSYLTEFPLCCSGNVSVDAK